MTGYLYDCDPEAVHGTPVPTAERRSLALIAADALKANCGACWAHPGDPCDAEGVHLARFARARRHRAISSWDMATVLDTAAPDPEDVFTPSTVIPADVLTGATS
jgi:hypothetical protein